jgi:hypothetical protein
MMRSMVMMMMMMMSLLQLLLDDDDKWWCCDYGELFGDCCSCFMRLLDMMNDDDVDNRLPW